MVFSAERGSAWTLAYPQYSVVVPQPNVVRVPVAFPMRAGDERLREFVNHWIEVRRRNGTLRPPLRPLDPGVFSRGGFAAMVGDPRRAPLGGLIPVAVAAKPLGSSQALDS